MVDAQRPGPMSPTGREPGEPSAILLGVLTLAAGALIANLYYAQPLVAEIGPAIGVSPDFAGSIVSLTQIGYGIGLFFLVSLADIVENKRLVLVTVGLTAAGLVGAATASGAGVFLAASLMVGLCSTGAQVLLPFLAQLVPPANRGRTVGLVMAGVLTGIMLARPAALFIAAAFGWRSVFLLSAGLMATIGLALGLTMPAYRPRARVHYGQILVSMVVLMRTMPALRWRAAYQALMFCAFNMFWTAVPLFLADRFHLGQEGIGLFALAGAGGALAAPVAGRLADQGRSRATTFAAMLVLGLSFLASCWTGAGPMALAVLTALAILIDAAVQTTQVVSQKVIFGVAAEHRGRVNAVYMTCLFAGGAMGSILGTVSYHRGGWPATGEIGTAIGGLLVLLLALERRSNSAGRADGGEAPA
jgi:predicted MFS family arabinose efflux permease